VESPRWKPSSTGRENQLLNESPSSVWVRKVSCGRLRFARARSSTWDAEKQIGNCADKCNAGRKLASPSRKQTAATTLSCAKKPVWKSQLSRGLELDVVGPGVLVGGLHPTRPRSTGPMWPEIGFRISDQDQPCTQALAASIGNDLIESNVFEKCAWQESNLLRRSGAERAPLSDRSLPARRNVLLNLHGAGMR